MEYIGLIGGIFQIYDIISTVKKRFILPFLTYTTLCIAKVLRSSKNSMLSSQRKYPFKPEPKKVV